MPLTVKDGVFLSAGMWCVAAATIAYRRKQTRAFKNDGLDESPVRPQVAYFLSWPVLGTAVIHVFGPSEEKMKKELEKNGFSEQQIDEQRRRVAAQMAQLRSAAEGGPQDSIWPSKAE